MYRQYASNVTPFQSCGHWPNGIRLLNFGHTLSRITLLSIGTGTSCEKPSALHRKCKVFEAITGVHKSRVVNRSQDCWMEPDCRMDWEHWMNTLWMVCRLCWR